MKLNSLRYESILWVNGFLKLIPGKLGCLIRRNFLPIKRGKNFMLWDNVHVDSPSKLVVGENVSINRGCIINAGGNVFIGNDVMIGPNVVIYSQNHNYKRPLTNFINQGYSFKSVIIGNNVWIASNVIILPGVTIGKNSVVAAGAILTKSIPENSIVKNDLNLVISNIN
jgi:maltose O-acetyltransferase